MKPKLRNMILSLLVVMLFLLPTLASRGLVDFLSPPELSLASTLIYPIAIYVLLALGLNIVVGKSGLLDLGYVAFFAVGAYSYSLLSIHTALPALALVLLTMLICLLFGLIFAIPSFRMNGDYLAIVTLALGEIVGKTLNNLTVFGGTEGLAGIRGFTSIGNFTFDIMHPENYYYLTFTIIIVVVLYLKKLEKGRVGRAWESLREDEDLSEIYGLPVVKFKIYAFILSGIIGGIAGAIFASKAMYISPDTFNYAISVIVLSSILLGGVGNIYGVILGASIIAYLPERIRFISDARQLVFGIILLLVINLKPNGLFPRKTLIYKENSKTDPKGRITKLQPDSATSAIEITKKQEKREIMIAIKDLTFGFNQNNLLEALTLEIKSHEVTALIGPNGAGKTTIFNILTKYYNDYQGNIIVAGIDLATVKKREIVKLGIGRTFQQSRVMEDMDVSSNLAIASDYKFFPHSLTSFWYESKVKRKIQSNELHAYGERYFPQINLSKKMKDLSFCERRLIEILRAICSGARILLLDEPAAGFASSDREALLLTLAKLKADGYTIVIVEHDLNFIKEICDRIVVLSQGNIIYDGLAKGIEKNHNVKIAYLGEVENA